MARELVYRGKRIQVAVDQVTLPDGRVVQRDVVQHPGAVAIVPLVDAGHVCLLRNRREIVGETLLEIPAGTLEPGEAPEPAARRELAEETGYQAARWRPVAEFYPSPGVLSERLHLFLAEDLTAGAPHPEPGEQLEPLVVPWGEALAWIRAGKIRDAKTLVGLLLVDRLREGNRLPD
jgi:ADP-ribose pyrophosphatase